MAVVDLLPKYDLHFDVSGDRSVSSTAEMMSEMVTALMMEWFEQLAKTGLISPDSLSPEEVMTSPEFIKLSDKMVKALTAETNLGKWRMGAERNLYRCGRCYWHFRRSMWSGNLNVKCPNCGAQRSIKEWSAKT